MSKCPWCNGFESIPPNPEKELCVTHLLEFAKKFPDRAKRRRK